MAAVLMGRQAAVTTCAMTTLARLLQGHLNTTSRTTAEFITKAPIRVNSINIPLTRFKVNIIQPLVSRYALAFILLLLR